MENSNFFIAQVFCFLCLIAYVISTQVNTRRSVLFYRTLSNIFSAFAYILLFAYTGFMVNVVGTIRNVLLTRYDKKSPPYIFTLSFVIIEIILAVIFYDGWPSLLVVIHSIICTIFICNPDLTRFRFSQLFSMPIIVIYNIIVGAYAGLAVNFVQTVFLIAGIERYDQPIIEKRIKTERRRIIRRHRKFKRELAARRAEYEAKKKAFLKARKKAQKTSKNTKISKKSPKKSSKKSKNRI